MRAFKGQGLDENGRIIDKLIPVVILSTRYDGRVHIRSPYGEPLFYTGSHQYMLTPEFGAWVFPNSLDYVPDPQPHQPTEEEEAEYYQNFEDNYSLARGR